MIQSSLYRAFVLNPNGGIQRAEILSAVDDAEAIRLVGSMANDHGIELWDRDRVVARSKPPSCPTVRSAGG